MSVARRAGAALAALMAAGGVALSGSRLSLESAGRRESAQVLYLPSGRYLKVVSLGFPEVLADLVYIWSIQFYGNYDRPDRFAFLDHVYSGVISELDPRYVDPYLVGSMIMSVEAGEHEMALRLLDKGMAANPSEWILPFEAGFTCYHVLKDYPRAARYFERALAVPGVPGVIRRLRAEMYNKAGDKRSSLGYWQEVLDTADNDYVRDVAFHHVHDLTIEVDLESLRQAIEAYRARTGSPPRSPDALTAAGLLASIPVDPEGRPYLYDPATGEVRTQSRFFLRRAGP